MFYVWLAVYILIHTRYDYEEKTNNSGKIIIWKLYLGYMHTTKYQLITATNQTMI